MIQGGKQNGGEGVRCSKFTEDQPRLRLRQGKEVSAMLNKQGEGVARAGNRRE